jgi:hypothetical protein
MSEQGAGAGRPDAAARRPQYPSAGEVRRRLELGLRGLDLDRIATVTLVLAVLVSGALLYHLTRGTSFWGDDWDHDSAGEHRRHLPLPV